MKNLLTGLIPLAIYALCLYGWIANIYKLTQCDFDTPLKTEVFRSIGILIFPVGIVMGYVEMEDDKN